MDTAPPTGAPHDVRTALADATAVLLTTATSLSAPEWERPATDRWTVREVFAHVVRSLTVVGDYLDADLPRRGAGLAGAVGYYRAALAVAGVHDGIARRASDAASEADVDPVPGPDRRWPPPWTGRRTRPTTGSSCTRSGGCASTSTSRPGW